MSNLQAENGYQKRRNKLRSRTLRRKAEVAYITYAARACDWRGGKADDMGETCTC